MEKCSRLQKQLLVYKNVIVWKNVHDLKKLFISLQKT